MEVILAKSAGYCFGVTKAVNTVYEQIEAEKDGRKIYTFGPIIHNKEVVGSLREKGVDVITGEDDIEKIKGSVLIIRSHGAGRSVYEKAEKAGVSVIDATCPFVKKIHRIAQKTAEEGGFLIIIGDRSHPEVQGILGWAGSNCAVIDNEEDAEKINLPEYGPVTVVSQTTFNLEKFEKIVAILNKRRYDVSVICTICSATEARQTEAAAIAESVDCMIVIGDMESSNTQKLFEICKSRCADTYLIQTAGDLPIADLQSCMRVGITAGASAPNYIIQEVLHKCQTRSFLMTR